MNGWFGFDLDGTLAVSTPGQRAMGFGYIGAPVPAMVERAKRYLAEGKDVRIFTARVAGFSPGTPGWDEATAPIAMWCQVNLGQVVPITATKDFGMICLFDDRAVQVEENTGRLIGKEL